MLLVYTPASDGIQAQYRSRLGELQSLKLSKKIVMRVWSQRPQRLRSRVLVRFDGTAWSRDATALRIREPKPTPVVDEDSRAFLATLPGVDFQVEADALEDQKWIRTKIVRVDGEGLVTPGGSFLVRVPLDFVQVDSANVVFPPIRTRVRMYGVLHAVNHQRAQIGSPSESALEMTTELPEGLDPRIQELSDELAEGATSTEEVVEHIVEHLRSEYHYSLDLGAIDPVHPLSDFLFERELYTILPYTEGRLAGAARADYSLSGFAFTSLRNCHPPFGTTGLFMKTRAMFSGVSGIGSGMT